VMASELVVGRELVKLVMVSPVMVGRFGDGE